MKEELKKKKKLQDFAKVAGAGGIKNAVSDETKNKITKTLSDFGKKVAEVGTQTVGSMAGELLKRKKKKQLP